MKGKHIVGILYCDGERFKKALLASASWLSENSETLNRLNVFPVPDGDTGTNMSLTLISAVDELKNLDDTPLSEVLEASARGALMGARGCSGVIISQLIAGFAEVGQDKTKFYLKDIIDGFHLGSKKTYQAVTEPREGTILTVIRESAEEASKAVDEKTDLVKLLERVLNKAKQSLENTPKLLPVLAQAGVVDAGGQGFVYMLEGIIRLLKGESLTIHEKSDSIAQGEAQKMVSDSWETPYCTEFILTPKGVGIDEIRKDFSHLGTDLVVIAWQNMIRVHIHTSDPEKILAHAHIHGKPSNVKIDDMKKQHRHITQSPIILNQDQHQDISMIAVAPGVGISAVFKSLGVESVLMSDQKNPSVSELIRAIDSAYSNKVILLPNDGNIIPAGIQAINMSHKDARIIPSKNVSQGMSAVLTFRNDIGIDENLNIMEKSLKRAKNGEIAKAIRNAQYENISIEEGNAIGRFNGRIHLALDDVNKAVIELLKIMVDGDSEIITLFYGADISRNEAEMLVDEIMSIFPDIEFDLHYGGQLHCYYILSVE